MSTTTRTKIRAKITRKEASLEIAYASYDAALADLNESYRFDSGEGSQSAKKRDIKSFKEQIDELESEIDSLNRRLCGKGLTRISLRRSARTR